MAITLNKPDANSRFFAFWNGSAMNVINNVIDWDSDTNNTVKIEYSKDSGVGWTVIATGVASIIGNNTYDWCLTHTELTDIIGTGHENDLVQIKVTDETTAAHDESPDFTLGEVSFTNICPNLTNNPDPLHNDAIFEIVWGRSYDEGIANVLIEFKLDAGAWTTLIASTPNTGKYCPTNGLKAVSAPPNGFSAAADISDVLIRISGVDPSSYGLANCIGYNEVDDTETSGFEITITNENAPQGDTHAFFPERKEMFARTAIEKGYLPDEAVAVAQLEAGYGIIIEQRDYDGILYPGDSTEPKLAGNIRISVLPPDDPEARPTPREIQGVLDFTASGAPTAEAKIAGPDNYGSCYSLKITHGWNLGSNSWLDELGVNIYANQNKNSYILEIVQVSAAGTPSIQYDVQCYWEAFDKDAIKVYCTLKGTEVDPTNDPATVDSLVTLSKDRLAIDPGTYKFEYRLREVIPN